MRRYFFLFLLHQVVLFNSLKGNNIVIQDINREYGLPKNRVNCMVQDSQGFLWFGMVNGLYKFDLNVFAKYKQRENNYDGFPEIDVKAIVEISLGKFMVGANKGLYVFNAEKETYKIIDCKTTISFSDIHVQSICASYNNSYWIGTDKGLMNIAIINKDKLEFELLRVFDESNSNLRSNEVIEIRKSPGDTIWFLTTSDIGFFNISNQNITTFTAIGANSSILFNKNKIIQSNFGDGISIFDTKSLAYEHIDMNEQLVNTKIRYTYKDSNGKFWLSVSNVGLLLMDSITQKNNISLISNKKDKYSTLNSNVIYKIYGTNDGAIWLCTEEGINMISLKPEIFKTVSFQSRHNEEFAMGVRALHKSNDKFIWIGSIGNGLFRYNCDSQSIKYIPVLNQGEQIGNIVQAIVEDTRGNLWLGTEGDGLVNLIFDKDYLRKPKVINYRVYPHSFPKNSVLNDYVMCLLEDKQKNIWIGTWYGLSLFRHSEISKKNQNDASIQNFLHNPGNSFSLSDNTIMSLMQDSAGTIWVGTLAGINKIVPTHTGYMFESNFKNSEGSPLTNKKILELCQDRNGDIWFSTQDGGICLLHIHTGIFEEFNASNGFHDHIVNSISQDSLGILWLGTNNGLCRFDPENFTFNMYYTEDGLLSNDFFYRTNCEVNNLLFFGGDKGITYFNPYGIIPGKIEPNLIFTNFKLFNETVSLNSKKSPLKKQFSYVDKLNLKFDQNYITIEFATLNFQHQKEIQYSCILEGLENSWNKLKRERKVSYTNLKPGHYIFKVKSFSTVQNTSIAEISMPITIYPPFWRTIVAYICYFILITLIIIYSYRFFLNEEKKQHALTLERINSKRRHEMDMMKLQFYTNVSHELRTPLTLISAPLESLMNDNPDKDKTQSYYQLMHKNVQRLRRLITQLLDMRKIEEGHIKMEWSQGDVFDFIQRVFVNFETFAEKRSIRFSLQSTEKKLYTFFDADKLEKVIFNLLSNAFKYTPDKGNIFLRLELFIESMEVRFENGYYEIKIIDSGFGIPQESIRNIYKPFHQVKKNKPIGSAGSGIGLSLTKELVELHGGEISVESEVDKGSVFTVKLPIIKERPSGSQESGEKEHIAEENSIEVETKNQINGTTSKPLVLIVEDDDELRNFICGELIKHFRIIEASNGKDGFKTAVDNIPDLIVSDVMMDEMDGIDMCNLIKEDIRTSHIPIIILTARHSEEIKQNSFDFGADEYIIKPFNINLLEGRITNLIEQRRKLRKLFGNGNNIDYSDIAMNKTDAKFIEKLNHIIEKNIDNIVFNPVLLASEMAMSKMQLYRKVSALTNQTVFNYIRTIRMNKAAQLLATTDMQIAEVAYSIGFSEASNFTKTFLKHFNRTPSQFAKEHRK